MTNSAIYEKLFIIIVEGPLITAVSIVSVMFVPQKPSGGTLVAKGVMAAWLPRHPTGFGTVTYHYSLLICIPSKR